MDTNMETESVPTYTESNMSAVLEPRSFQNDNIQQPLIENGFEKSKIDHGFLFMTLGASTLMAYNLIINSIDVYQDLLQTNRIGTLISQVYHFPVTITSFILCFIKIKNVKWGIIITQAIVILILALIPLLILFFDKHDILYWSSLILIGTSGVFSEILFSVVFILASQFTSQSTCMFSSGNALSGFISFALRLATKAIFKKVQYSAACYYFIGTALMLFSLSVFIYNLKKFDDVEKGCHVLASEEKPASFFSKRTCVVIKEIGSLWMSQFINFLITLTLFPGYLVSVPPRYGLGTWTSVIITSTFCFFELFARMVPRWFVFPKSRKHVWILVSTRLIFFPIFMLSLQKVIKMEEPLWTFLWNIPFSITNGYDETIIMMYSNNTEFPPDEQQLATLLMSFSLTFGIFCAMFMAGIMPNPKT